LRDLVRVHIELLRQFGQGPLALHRGQGHPRLERSCVVGAGSFRLDLSRSQPY
jgi:hypothetical protein